MKKNLIPIMSVVIMSLLFVNLNAQVTFTNYTTDEGLANDVVYGGVCIDQNNTKWFGTEGGISRFDGNTWISYSTTDGLVDNSTTCIAYDNENDKIWIGTNNGVSVFDGTSFENYTTTEGLNDNTAQFITVDDNGVAWVATFGGLSKIDNGAITNFGSADGMSSDLTTFVTAVGTNLYIGTLNAGFMIYDGTTFETIGTTDGLLDNYVSTIFVDDAGNIYVGSYAGLTVFDSELTVTNTYTMEVELFNEYVQDVVVYGNGNLIVLEYADYLSDGGVSVFDGTDWNLYTVDNGLVDAMVKEAELDNEGNVWITTGSGVSKMSLGSGVGTNFLNVQSKVYPNPATDYIIIANIDGAFSYQITDITGRIVDNGQNIETNTIDVSALPNSMYFITFENKGKEYSAKIIVE